MPWRPVPGLPFEASTDGQIRGADGRIRTVKPNAGGYFTTSNGRGSKLYFHDLVAAAFHGPKPAGSQVRHLNDVKSDNRPENLRYGTFSEQRLDSVRNGTHPMASKTHCKRGHEFTPANTGIQKQGKGRFCRECVRQQRHACYLRTGR